MKNVVVVFFILVSMTSFGQKRNNGDVELGLNLGFNASNVTNSDGKSDDGSGFNAGASADYFFSNRWSIKGKMIYDQKGWDNGYFNNLDAGNSYTTNYNLNYLTIPVMANWHFGGNRNWYLNFGPYLGFLLSASESATNFDVKEAFNSTDFGLALGIGVKIPVTDNLKISFEYEEQGGFSDIFKQNISSATRNGRTGLNVGLVFMLR